MRTDNNNCSCYIACVTMAESFSYLPNEIIHEILIRCNKKNLLKMRLVSKQMCDNVDWILRNVHTVHLKKTKTIEYCKTKKNKWRVDDIDLSFNPFVDLEIIRHLTSIRRLDLSFVNGKIDNIEVIQHMHSLRALKLQGACVGNDILNPIRDLKLTILDLRETHVSDTEPIRELLLRLKLYHPNVKK